MVTGKKTKNKHDFTLQHDFKMTAPTKATVVESKSEILLKYIFFFCTLRLFPKKHIFKINF